MSSVSVDLNRAAEALALEERIRRIPSTAKVRGVFFHLMDGQLRKRGLAASPEWRLAAEASRRMHALYPAADFLRAMTVAGALVDPDPRQGVRLIFSEGAPFAANTWIGRAFRAALSPDPLQALRWLERSHDYVCNYGRWRLEERAPGRATLHMFDEYCWIDSLHLGGCEGLLRACGVTGSVHATMDGMFSGRLEIFWRLRN
ncbi:MAG TPA: TIGR02265 family protein [Polyangiaceae bacterium]